MANETQRSAAIASWQKGDRIHRAALVGLVVTRLAMTRVVVKTALPSAISGVTRLYRLKTNVKAAEWTLTPDKVAEIDAILQGKDA